MIGIVFMDETPPARLIAERMRCHALLVDDDFPGCPDGINLAYAVPVCRGLAGDIPAVWALRE